YLSQPIENVPYEYYLEFKSQPIRYEEYQGSYSFKAIEQHQAVRQAATLSLLGSGSPVSGILGLVADATLQNQMDPVFEWNRPGKFASFVEFTVPLCLGDYFGPYRVVGTTPEMFNLLHHGDQGQHAYTFESEGRNFEHFDSQNGFFEAVVGAVVARDRNVKMGDKINPSHGSEEGDSHATEFTVVGIMEPTGTPNDRAVFINMEGFYRMSDHARPLENEDPFGSDQQGHKMTRADYRLPVEKREVTAMLVRMDPLFSIGAENAINEGPVAQAVFPVIEIRRLLDVFVTPVKILLLVLTVMICVVSGVSILISIYNSMNERRGEIAVLRALGARRLTVYWIVSLESMILSVSGGVLGFLIGHGLIAMSSPFVEARTGVRMGFFDFAPPLPIPIAYLNQVSPELLLIPGLVLLAAIVGFIPAYSAYRTDVAQSLGK
ncbi:MAG: ABC transporter permease, partial [Planctomycetota bacterium]|nr:ABC transporter permease [Planctomycetota bacterium]